VYSEDIINRVRDSVDIVDLVSGYVSLKKTGKNHLGLCPFHSEKTPSFNVNADKQIFHCFGCGVGGDAFKFLELQEG
jgi:DNA primase